MLEQIFCRVREHTAESVSIVTTFQQADTPSWWLTNRILELSTYFLGDWQRGIVFARLDLS